MKKKKFRKLAAGVFCITFLSLGSVSAKGEELLTDSNALQEDNKEPLNFRKEEETDLFNSGITEEPAKKIENASTSGAAEKPAEKIEDTFTSKATEEPAGKIEDAFTSGSTEEPGEKDEDGEKEEDAVRIIQDGIIYQEEESYNRYFHVVGYTEEAKGKTELIIPESVNGRRVSEMDPGCFSGLEDVKLLELSKEMWWVTEDVFDSWEGITIRCALNSDAYFFAVKHGIPTDTSTILPDYDRDDTGVVYVLDEKTKTYSAGMVNCVSREPADIVFRREIMGCPVVEIETPSKTNYYDDDEPMYFRGVGSVYIPNSIQRIAGGEFTYSHCYDYAADGYIKDYGFANLTKVVFEDGETPIELGEHLFDYCPSLKEVILSSRIRELPARMFTECPALTRLELPEGMTKIGQAALQGASNLEYLYIPSSVTEIADDAMKGLTKLTVHGEENSYAEYYCRIHGIPFEGEGNTEQEKPYILSSKGELKNHWLYFTVELLREMEGAEGYEYQTLANDGKTVLRTKTVSEISCVLAKAPNDIYVRVRSWKTEQGEKVYSQWSDPAHLFLEVKAGTMVLKKASSDNAKVTLTFKDNPNFFKESDGFDCRLEKIGNKGKTYVKKNQKYRSVTFANVKPGTYTAKARAYKLVNGEKIYGERSNTIQVTVK